MNEVIVMHQKTLHFEQIYKESYPAISRYVVCHCKNIEDVKDILQEIYLHVYQHILKGKEVNKEYVFGIAKNKVKDYYRFSYKYKIISIFTKHHDELEIIDTIPDDYDLEREAILKCTNEEIWNYLIKKPIIISKIFYLYYFLELSINEIATELDLTESNVKNYIYRTLKELRKEFEKEEL